MVVPDVFGMWFQDVDILICLFPFFILLVYLQQLLLTSSLCCVGLLVVLVVVYRKRSQRNAQGAIALRQQQEDLGRAGVPDPPCDYRPLGV